MLHAEFDPLCVTRNTHPSLLHAGLLNLSNKRDGRHRCDVLKRAPIIKLVYMSTKVEGYLFSVEARKRTDRIAFYFLLVLAGSLSSLIWLLYEDETYFIVSNIKMSFQAVLLETSIFSR